MVTAWEKSITNRRQIRSILRGTIVGIASALVCWRNSPSPARRPASRSNPRLGPEKAFGQALREIRMGKEISQEQLGLDAGFDRTYISLIERGINSPTIRTVVKLARVLQVPPSVIVARMEQLIPGREK